MGWFSFSKKKSGQKASSANSHGSQHRAAVNRQSAGNEGASSLLSSKKPTRTYDTGQAKMYQRSMANMFASDNGLRIYTGFEKNLRKLIEKTAGKDAAKCSGADSTRFLARACWPDGHI